MLPSDDFLTVEVAPSAPQARTQAAQAPSASLPPSDVDLLLSDDLWPDAEGEPTIGLVNGRFNQANQAAADFGWTPRGTIAVQNGIGVLNENASFFSGLSQDILIPAGATALRFTLVGRTLGATAAVPPDALEVALLRTDTLESLVPTVQGLAGSDAFFNLQASGELFFGSTTSVTGATTSGQSPTLTFPTIVTVSLAGIPADTPATLFVDLLAFGALDSSVQIDNVTIIGFDAPPLTARLAQASDSGSLGDNITNISPVTITGTTDALATVAIDRDGDGFDDGTTTADISGVYSISGVPLVAGLNNLRVQGGVTPATTIVTLPVTFDTTGPTATLITPAPGSSLTNDAGFVDLQWNEAINVSTLGIDDISITGVTVDRAENRGNNVVRYFYGDNDILPAGNVEVRQIPGRVADLAGNLNTQVITTFTAVLLVSGGLNPSAEFGSPLSLVGARFSFAGSHSLLTLTVDWGDGQVQPITLPAGSGGGNITASHTYTTAGVFPIKLRLVDNLARFSEDTVQGVVSLAGCPWQNPDPSPNGELNVDADTEIAPLDALLIINDLNEFGPRDLPNPIVPPFAPPPFFDTSCDGKITPLDALLVINYLNGQGDEEPEAEPASASSQDFTAAMAAWMALEGVATPSALAHDDAADSDYSRLLDFLY